METSSTRERSGADPRSGRHSCVSIRDERERDGLATFLFSEPVAVDYLEIIDQEEEER